MDSYNTRTSHIVSTLQKLNSKFLLLLLKAALYFENSQIRSTWNKVANIHLKIIGIINSPHTPDMHLAWKIPTSVKSLVPVPTPLTPMPKNGETTQGRDNQRRRGKAGRTAVPASSNRLSKNQWKLPNALLGTVLPTCCFYFPSIMNAIVELLAFFKCLSPHHVGAL